MNPGRSVAAFVALMTVGACAQNPQDVVVKDEFEGKPWQELQGMLPAAPKPENLFRIGVGPASNFQYLVDAKSIGVNPQGIVRFTLVARSANGASNVSFEGLRCETLERRVYAFGRSDGAWSQTRNSPWLPIEKTDSTRPYAALVGEFFCVNYGHSVSAEEIVKFLKQGGYQERPTQGLN